MRRQTRTGLQSGALPRFREPWRRWVLLALLVALPVSGLAGALSSFLGFNHRHHQLESFASLDGWQDFRRVNIGGNFPPRPHSHSLWQRHHHERSDASVVALDGQAQDVSSGEASSSSAPAELMFAASDAFELFEPVGARACWPCKPSKRVATVSVAPPERPPKA
jgi:hypothetical protein